MSLEPSLRIHMYIYYGRLCPSLKNPSRGIVSSPLAWCKVSGVAALGLCVIILDAVLALGINEASTRAGALLATEEAAFGVDGLAALGTTGAE